MSDDCFIVLLSLTIYAPNRKFKHIEQWVLKLKNCIVRSVWGFAQETTSVESHTLSVGCCGSDYVFSHTLLMSVSILLCILCVMHMNLMHIMCVHWDDPQVLMINPTSQICYTL